MTNNKKSIYKNGRTNTFPGTNTKIGIALLHNRTPVIGGHTNIQIITGKMPTMQSRRVATAFSALMSCKHVTYRICMLHKKVNERHCQASFRFI